MVIEEKVVADVADGWVVFQDKADPAGAFRRSAEVHLLTTGRNRSLVPQLPARSSLVPPKSAG